jgi:hypothetical protein
VLPSRGHGTHGTRVGIAGSPRLRDGSHPTAAWSSKGNASFSFFYTMSLFKKKNKYGSVHIFN